MVNEEEEFEGPLLVMGSNGSALKSLYNILQQESIGGYCDTVVIGGLDRFLQRWARDLVPVLGEFRSYSVLDQDQRKVWAEKVLDLLGEIRPANKSTIQRRSVSKKLEITSPKSSLDDNILTLKGVSTRNVNRLKSLGVETICDLLYLFPRRHNDFANTRKIADLVYGEEQTVVVTVWEASETRQGPKRRSTQAVLGDETGNVRAIWFNQPYLSQIFRPGTHIVISGKVNVFRGSFVFESPEYELLKGQEDLVHTGRLVPVYPSVNGLPQRTLRRFAKQALDVGINKLVDYLPKDTLKRMSLMALPDAVYQAHYPNTSVEWSAARRRLAFDELLLLQLAVLTRKRDWQQDGRGIPLEIHTELIETFLNSLPFNLTGAQVKVLEGIFDHLKQNKPMSCLLQGDVGSGKTVVAVVALIEVIFNGYQGAFIAPTEILAEQHFLTVVHLFSSVTEITRKDHLVSVNIASSSSPITVALLIGSLPRKVKADIHRQIASGEVDLVIGTHAVIQDNVNIPNLALAVVDEQHRFGVMQRTSIRNKGQRPHLLAMSATPIPRSLALTNFGDLDILTIDEMPPGRHQIRTRWVEPSGRLAAYRFVAKQIEEKRQAFIVCPLIDESEVVQTRAATEEHERLAREVFPDLRLGLLHGRMSLHEKEQVMDCFQSGEIDILVSTPVVEVGIDVPNATVMLIDGADRFGLSQLHQFRGRVGRGSHQSYCLLLSDAPGEDARERLKLVERIKDGFELAEEDLRMRGPGDYMGTRQSGIPTFSVARITDHEIMSLARVEAIRILKRDPYLVKKENALLVERLETYAAHQVEILD